MELIVLNIGLDLGVISPTVFAMMVVMALVTTFMTEPVLAAIYPEHLRTEEALDAPRATPEPAPNSAAFRPLICVADQRSGLDLLAMASALRGGAEAHGYALHLIPPRERASDYVEEGKPSAPETHPALGPVLAKARELSLPMKPISFVSSDPAEDILSVARVHEVDVVLLGLHKPVLRKSRLSGIVARVLRESPFPVGVVVPRASREWKRILVPFVGTDFDRAALRLVRQMIAGRPDRSVTVLHVRGKADLRSQDPSLLLHAEPAEERVELEVVYDDSPVDVAIEKSKAGYDLVVVGLGREWGLHQPWLGMHSERLISESPVSLLIVGGGEVAESMSSGAA